MNFLARCFNIFQVGAVIVNTDGIVVGSGYNGRPVPGVSNEEFTWGKGNPDEMLNKTLKVVHAGKQIFNNKIHDYQ